MSEKHHCRGCGREVEIETTRCPECGALLETVVTESGGEPFEEFVSSLVKTHGNIRHRLRVIGTALERQDKAVGIASLRELKDTLDRHVVDEEARVLKVLIDAHGREGAGEAIRTMQQHRQVHKLVGEVIDSLPTSAEEAPRRLAALEALLDEHFKTEEGRIFPWAIDTHAKPRREAQSRNE